MISVSSELVELEGRGDYGIYDGFWIIGSGSGGLGVGLTNWGDSKWGDEPVVQFKGNVRARSVPVVMRLW